MLDAASIELLDKFDKLGTFSNNIEIASYFSFFAIIFACVYISSFFDDKIEDFNTNEKGINEQLVPNKFVFFLKSVGLFITYVIVVGNILLNYFIIPHKNTEYKELREEVVESIIEYTITQENKAFVKKADTLTTKQLQKEMKKEIETHTELLSDYYLTFINEAIEYEMKEKSKKGGK